MKKKGFTLIELLAVIAILTILILFALPTILRLYRNARMESFENEVKSLCKQAQNQIIVDSLNLNSGETKIYASDIVNNTISEGKLELQGGNDLKYCILLDNSGNIKKLYVSNGTYQYKSEQELDNIENIEVEDIIGEDIIEGKNSCLTKVTLKYNDGIYEDENIYVEYGQKYKGLPNPTKDGYTFKGWSRLDGYQELDYIVSNGNQYIDTDYYFKANERFEGKIYTTVQNTEMALIALYDTLGIFEVGFSKTNNMFFNWSATGNIVSLRPEESIYNTELTFITSNNSSAPYRELYLSVADGIYTSGGTSSGAVGNHKLRLLAIQTSYKFQGRTYYFKIYDNDILVRDFIPCYRISDNVKGLYDLVENVFYPNASNSGVDFTIGNKLYIDNDTIVSNSNSHTLTAIWEKNN